MAVDSDPGLAADDLTDRSRNGCREVDLDLGGLIGIRLVDARPRDVETVLRQLGPVRRPLSREPDIVVRFVDRIDDPRVLTYAAWPEGGFTDEAFYLLKGADAVRGRALIPFQDVGGRCEITCERRLGTVPLLLAVINFTALAKGVLPLHASAFVLDGTGVLAAGWAKGGKTEMLLAAAGMGAAYVGDEWVYLSPDGDLFGVPEPIRLWGWQLQQLPEVARRLPASARRRLAMLGHVSRSLTRIADRRGTGGPLTSVLRRAAPVLRRQVYVQMPPAQLFGVERLALRGRLDRLVLASSHEDAAIRVDTVDGTQVADRMAASLVQEREPFMAAYRQFRFAFPDRSSPVVDAAEALEKELLHRSLDGRTAWWVRHPYPMQIGALVPAIGQIVSRG